MSFLNIIGKEAELLEAARTGNLQTVEKLLSSKSKKSQHVGGAIGQKLTSFLKSVNVNHTDKNGYTALHHAAVNGHRDVVEALLKAEAQPGHVDNQGCTPVHLAAWNGDAEIVMQLLTAGTDSEVVNPVNVNQQNGTGDTALHCAAQYGHVAVVDVLLQKSANPTIRNLNEASPLDLAAQYGRLEVVQRLLISHPELARHPSSTQSPLHLASRNGHRDIAAVLLDHHFDIQTMTETGNALHEAALHGKLDVVKLLLERGIDVNQRDDKGQTVLELLSAHQAQQKSFTEITRAIQEHMRESGQPNADPGLYDSLASCHSGVNKPTAAVKPLPPEKPYPSDKPLPPDKPYPSDTEKPEETTPDRPVPAPRQSVYHSSPVSEPESSPLVPMYSKPNKEKTDLDRVISTASSVPDEGPPPLPPRTSVFTLDDRHSLLPPEPSVPSIPESSPPGGKSTVQKPKKPPRQKRSPAPHRKSPVESQNETSTSASQKIDTNIPEQFVNIPTEQSVHNDSANCENSSQHSLPCPDQLHCNIGESDQLDNSKLSHSTQSSPPVKSSSPSLPPRKRENFSEPQVGRSVSQGFYVEMSSVNRSGQTKRPVSEVKPQVKDSNNTLNIQLQPPAQQGVDDYDILFPNLKKISADISNKPELRRMNTAPNPEDGDYVKPFPTSPTEKFKEKQGLLRRTHTAPDESTYLAMDNVKQEDAKKDSSQKDNEYAEIPEKEGSLSPGSPKENVYATITEAGESKHGTNLEVEGNEYSQIKDLSPVPSPRHSRETKGDRDSEKIESENSRNEERRTENDMKVEIKADSGKIDEDSKENLEMKGEKTNMEEDTEEKNINKGSPKPTHLDFLKNKPGTPLTPTGYPQPPTPDFPPPSPATAMLGIEMKIQQIDSKRKSRDITTITDDTLGCIQEQKSEVKATEDNSEINLNENSPEVRVTAEVKDSGIKESETKQSDLVKESKTGEDSKDLLSDKDSNLRKDQSKDSSSVIAAQTKSIPESSIPHTVIETEADRMSKNRPPIAKKPDMKSRSFKVKEAEGVTKRSDTETSDSVSVKVTDKREPENKAAVAGDITAKVTDELKSAKISKGESDKVTDQVVTESSTVEGNDSVNDQVRDQKQTAKNSTAEGGGSPVVLRRKTSTPDMDVFKATDSVSS